MTADDARVRGLEPEEWSDEVRALLLPTMGRVTAMAGDAEPGAETTEKRPLAVLTVLAHAPRLLGPFLGWAGALALEGELPRRDHELLALRAAWNCRSPFEWGHHVDYARGAGITDEEIERLVEGPDAGGHDGNGHDGPSWPPHESALLRAADELHRDSTIQDATWATLAATYGQAALVEISLIVGQYTMLSMLTNACGVALEPGHDPLPPTPGEAGS